MKLSDPVGVARGYEQHFGLVESPFGLIPNRRFLFESESYLAAVEQVTLSIRRRERLLVITGDIGTGKTLLCRTIQAVEPRTFVSVISSPRLSARDLLRQVFHDFGLVSEQSRSRAPDDTLEQEIVQTVQRFLTSLASLRAHSVIVIDEAQRLEPDAFELVRLLSSLEPGGQELLQVILVGRLDLDAMLDRPELRQLAGRVYRHHQLQPLKPHEVAPYVEQRLSIARGDPQLTDSGLPTYVVAGERFRRVLFTPVALRCLAALTRGFPRAVNVIGHRALEIAHGQQKKVVDAGCILAAARNLEVVIPFELHLRSRWRFRAAAVLVLVACAGALALRASGSLVWTTVGARAPSLLQRENAESPVVEEPATLAPLPEAESYSVAAASFRSEARAAQVASALRLLDLPVFIRPVESSHAVVVGPFASREEAVEAQVQISRVHLTNPRIVSTAPTRGAIVHPLRPVAMTGQKGQP